MNMYEIYFDDISEESIQFQAWLKKNGANYEFTKELVLSTDYNGYLATIAGKVVDEDTEDYYSEILSIDYAGYIEFKDSAIKMIEEYLSTKDAPSDEASQIIPYHKILNGNFDKINHSVISEQEKIFYNVDGLPDDMWDVYIDVDENGKLTGRFKTVYYDMITKNKQFWDFHMYLKKFSDVSKIRFNDKIHLIVFDRDLLGIDTMSILPGEMQVKVAREGMVNPWFHMRECARITKNGESKRFEMTIQQFTFIWLYCQNFNTFLSAPRQIGKTYIVNHLLAYEFAYGSTDFECGFLHYEYTRAVDNKREVIEIADEFPEFLRFHQIVNRRKKGVEYKNVEPSSKSASKETKNQQLGNTLVAIAVSPQEQQAARAGRGRRLRFLLFDEFNFVKCIMAAMSGIQFATTATMDFARKKGIRHSIHYASTAGDLTTLAGRQMYDVVTNKICKFDNKLFGMNYSSLHTYLFASAEMDFFFVEYGYQELGMSEAWYDDRRRKIPVAAKFRNEILMDWISSSADSLYTQEHIERVQTWIDAVKWDTHFLDNRYMIDYIRSSGSETIEDEFKKMSVLCMGIDIAHGSSGDSTVFFGMNMETCMPVFEYATNTLLVVDFPVVYKAICDLAWKANPNLVIISALEWDGPGQDILPVLERDPKYAKTLFGYTIYYNKDLNDRTVRGFDKNISRDSKTIMGSHVNGRRKWMTENLLPQLVELQPYTFCHPKALDEVKTLKRTKGDKGRVEAKAGAHDDRIFARLHAYGLVFDELYRENVYKKFNYVVDMHKIKFETMGEHKLGIMENEEVFLDREGELDWKLVDKYDSASGYSWQEIKCTKIINGIKVNLTLPEVIEESKNNLKLADVVMKVTSKMPSNVNLRKKNPFKNKSIGLGNDYRDVNEYKTIEDYWKPRGEDEGMLF